LPSKVELIAIPDRLVVMMKMNASIGFLLLAINFIFMPSLIASEELDVQYFFDDRFNYYSDSERISTRVNRRIFYKHSDVFKEALLDYEQNYKKISFTECNGTENSDFIVKLEPNFFYNPLMQTMYADLNYYLFQEPSKQIDHGSLTIKKQVYMQARHDIQLKNIYLEFLDQLSDVIPERNPEQKINGSFCSLL
jgi:hypothetical protein